MENPKERDRIEIIGKSLTFNILLSFIEIITLEIIRIEFWYLMFTLKISIDIYFSDIFGDVYE